MIIEALLNIVLTIIVNFLGLFPPLLLPPDIVGGLTGILEILSFVGFFLPIGAITFCIGVVIAFYNTRFVISIINWVIAKIPTIN